MAFRKRRVEQYQLIAYICGNACVRYADAIGTMDFTRVFTGRPDDCRYAVVTCWNIKQHAEEVLVYDLYATTKTRSDKLVPPKPMWRGDCIDAAIMATCMRYEES